MTEGEALRSISIEQLSLLSKEELIRFVQQERDLRRQEISHLKKLEKENEHLRALTEELRQRILILEDQCVIIKNKLFGKSSERSSAASNNRSPTTDSEKKPKIQLPSQRYPHAPLIERDVALQELPICRCCNAQMEDSGMTEDSEFLTVIPRQYFVVRQKRHKYRCGKCHGDVQTAPCPPRIKEGSVYSDEMIIDVAMTKYCDLMPIERYTAMAGREGLKDLPQQSLIETTHYLADFVKPAYDRLKSEILRSPVLHADETPHRMLEGDKKSLWFLWGFSNARTSYFECHDTRSGDVASQLLIPSQCRFLVSDVFSGYAKAVRETNLEREKQSRSTISHVYCNAHPRRRFKEARDRFSEDAEFFIQKYSEIYQLENEAKCKPPDSVLEIRRKMWPYYAQMKERAEALQHAHSSKSSIGKAMSYFLDNYDGFTRFIENPALPIDNNPAERLLRNPVIGRKTWYGTHSKQGAQTAAILFSLVESAKLNQLNPREYLKALVTALHQGKTVFTPTEFKSAN